jgi:hypothetical protein
MAPGRPPARGGWPPRGRWGRGVAVGRALRRLGPRATRQGAAAAVATGQERRASREHRRARSPSARVQAPGDPRGSGRVARAHPVVVERRLQGAGRHGARPPVHPLVARRTLAGSDRWAAAWPQIAPQGRQPAWQRRLRRLEARSPPPLPGVQSTPPPDGPVTRTRRPPLGALPMQPMAPPLCVPTLSHAPNAPYRPPPDHPWRRVHLGRAKSPRPSAAASAKL